MSKKYVAEGGFGRVDLACYVGNGHAETGLYPTQMVALKTLRVRLISCLHFCASSALRLLAAYVLTGLFLFEA